MQNAELFNVKDKTVLVTGGSRGIGLMIAKTFVANGAIVYISARSKNVCDKSAGELTKMGPGKCYSIPADLSSIPQVQMLVGELTKRTDRLDVLINNAGANWASPIEEFSCLT